MIEIPVSISYTSLNVGERLFNQTGVLRKNRYVQTSPPPNFFVDRISILN